MKYQDQRHYSQSYQGQNDSKRVKSQGAKHPEVKKIVLEPGNPCEPLEEIIGSTKLVENGVTTYMISKSLTGPLLTLASKSSNQSTTNTVPKQLPQIKAPVTEGLQPHLPGYSANTHEGIYRNYNQDKISIVIDQDLKWFGIYDGHGGDKCSQFLKEHLHQEFIRNKRWREDVKLALRQAFENVEHMWTQTGDKSGSCCLVTLIHEDICYVANLGDSRAILSSETGKKVYQISKDHKPSNATEQKRILSAGGKIYQTIAITEHGERVEQFTGPLRVYPGRLSTTRTFGDFEAKDLNPYVVISQPEITSFNIKSHDMIIMGSDGVWDRIENKEALKIVKDCLREGISPEQFCNDSTNSLLKQSMLRGSTDNVSVIVIGLPNLYQLLTPSQKNEEQCHENIKVLTSINSPSNIQVVKKKNKKEDDNKENYPSKLRVLDSRINEITRSAEKLTSHR